MARFAACSLVCALLGCAEAERAVVLLPEGASDIERFAVLRFDEGGALIAASGLLPVSQLPLELEDETTTSITVVGFGPLAFVDIRLPIAEVLETTPLRFSDPGDRSLPVPDLYASGAVLKGTVTLAPATPVALTSSWMVGPCPVPSAGRVERLGESDQFLAMAPLDLRSALFVTVGAGRTHLYRADLESTDPIDPPGFDTGGPGEFESTAAFFEGGRLWLAAAPRDGLTRIFSGTLEAGFELVSTSTRGERIGWIAPDRNAPELTWLLDARGVFHRLRPGNAAWEHHAQVVEAAAGPGRVAREMDGSLVTLHRSFPQREIARVRPDGTVETIPRQERHRPIFLLDLQPYPTFLGYDGLRSRVLEVHGPELFVIPGSEEGTATVEPLSMARITGGFALSGVQGFLAVFTEGTFCEVESGLLGADTVEHIVEVEGGLLSGPGLLRNGSGPADLTRVRLAPPIETDPG